MCVCFKWTKACRCGSTLGHKSYVCRGPPGFRQVKVIADDTLASSLQSQLGNLTECKIAKVEMTEEGWKAHYGSKKKKKRGVNNGLSCELFSGSFSPSRPQALKNACVIHCFFSFCMNASQYSTLSCTAHLPTHYPAGTDVCARKGFCAVVAAKKE